MNKKLSLLLALILSSFQSFPGGVTVGNGQGRVIVGLSLRQDFQKEEDLVMEAQMLIDEIHRGDNLRINDMIAQGNCEVSSQSVKSLKTQKFFKFIGDEISEEKEVIGYLQVELSKCKTHELISADEPYGGYEFWEL